MGINPATGIDDGLDMYGKKKQTPGMLDTGNTVPTVDPNNSNGVVALSKAATSGAAVAAPAPAQPVVAPVTDTTKGNEDVLKTAQTSVLNQPSNTALQGQTQGAVSNWLANPMGDFDPAKNKQQQLEKSNADWANSFDAMKRQYGGVSGSGLLQKNILGNMLQHNVDQSALESNIDTENYNKYVDSMGKSIGAAQIQNKSDADLYSQYLGNLGKVRGMAEGERAQVTGFDQATQAAATQNGYDLAKLDKVYGQDMAKLVATQDWTGGQAQLDREAAVAKQNKDIAAQTAVQDKQNAFDMEKLNKTQDWQGQQNKIDQDFKLAMQSNDINATSSNIQKQLDLDKWKQENGQTFTSEQNAMNRTLETSLKTMDIQGQKDVMDLKSKIDMNQMLTAQDFQGAQAGLDRALKTAMQGTDIQAQKDLTDQKATLDLQAQTAQNAFNQTLTKATQAWQTGERLSTEDFNKATQAIDIANKVAMQNNDIDSQKYLATQKNNLALQMQTNDMDQQTKMAYLNDQLTTAQKNGDVGRTEDIQLFQNNLKVQSDTVAYGREVALKNQDAEIASQAAAGNYDYANKLQNSKISEEARQFDATNAISSAELQLKQKGFTSDQIQAAVAAGAADPKSLTDFLTSAGIKTTPPDPLAAQKAADQKAADMLHQYNLTHPDSTVYTVPGLTNGSGSTFTKAEVDKLVADGKLTDTQKAGIKSQIAPSAIKQYNDFVNQTMYNEKTGQSSASKLAAANPSDLQGADQEGSPFHQDYVNALKVATPFDTAVTREGGSGLWENHTDKFKNPVPSIGVSFKGADGKLYIATAGIETDTSDGNKTEYFYALDPATGNTMKVSAENGGKYTTWQQALTKIVTTSAVDPTGLSAGGSLATNWM